MVSRGIQAGRSEASHVSHDNRENTIQTTKMDGWYGVEDAVERRRIQNRMAQRERRKRLVQSRVRIESAINDASQSTTCRSQNAPVTPVFLPLTESSQQSTATSLTLATGALSGRGTQDIAVSQHARRENLTTESEPITVWSALFHNGAMMGLSCSTNTPRKSLPQGPDIPATLHPTALQLTTFHPSWIDRFPFANMRDNFISMAGIIDEEDFLCDLFSMDSFRIKPGKPGWDPNAWIIGPDFGKKWGYLFY
ncbi:hypothetical protein LTR78_008114 [Recurvomyces mirabilis]|uniref:BZIP domain-containing protein n=1 Tax=Recurvomyces mirabilis TaxID=574656 RepID=A0AAE0WHT1_9PEZI|nr:hypothetical protein LTR78_008114 [Recurvomyces mirabilis]KAK5150686.1 hypothetical protein LTS14_009969 [Recurvomyces mirabilis]